MEEIIKLRKKLGGRAIVIKNFAGDYVTHVILVKIFLNYFKETIHGWKGELKKNSWFTT